MESIFSWGAFFFWEHFDGEHFFLGSIFFGEHFFSGSILMESILTGSIFLEHFLESILRGAFGGKHLDLHPLDMGLLSPWD